jgi:hypothetical protein
MKVRFVGRLRELIKAEIKEAMETHEQGGVGYGNRKVKESDEIYARILLMCQDKGRL